MTTMIDREGRTWTVGDLVWEQDRKRQGVVTEVVGQDMLRVQFPGDGGVRFVSGLVRTGHTHGRGGRNSCTRKYNN